jgi:hypothetical protein
MILPQDADANAVLSGPALSIFLSLRARSNVP